MARARSFLSEAGFIPSWRRIPWRIMAGVFSDPDRILAAGGIVRILNGCEVAGGEIHLIKSSRQQP